MQRPARHVLWQERAFFQDKPIGMANSEGFIGPQLGQGQVLKKTENFVHDLQKRIYEREASSRKGKLLQ